MKVLHKIFILRIDKNIVTLWHAEKEAHAEKMGEILPLNAQKTSDFNKIIFEQLSCMLNGRRSYKEWKKERSLFTFIYIKSQSIYSCINIFCLQSSFMLATDGNSLDKIHRLYSLRSSVNWRNDIFANIVVNTTMALKLCPKCCHSWDTCWWRNTIVIWKYGEFI